MVRRLLSADPRMRFCCRKNAAAVGDDPSTAAGAVADGDELVFDLEAFKNHPFFADEDAQRRWTRFESDLAPSCAEVVSSPSAVSPLNLSRTPCSQATVVTYRDEPKHDEAYAQYALSAGASDIERWWLDAVEGAERDNRAVAKQPCEATAAPKGATVAAAAAKAEASEEKQAEARGDEEEDDTMHVIDDVGQQQFIVGAFGKDNDDS